MNLVHSKASTQLFTSEDVLLLILAYSKAFNCCRTP